MNLDPVWTPSPVRVADANLSRFIRYVAKNTGATVDDYPTLYDFSIRRPQDFWPAVWEFCGIRSSGDWTEVVDDVHELPGARWFSGARLNFAQNLLRHADDKPAIIFRAENGERRELSHRDLRDEVARLAGALQQLGVTRGDRVAGFLPNLPETVIAMLAATSLGAIWSSCSPDFGSSGVIDRLGQIEPKVLFAADGYHYGGKVFDSRDRLARILAAVPSVEKTIVIGYVEDTPDLAALPTAVDYRSFAQSGEGRPLQFEQLPFDHPLYILYSSGTTGVPKCIVHRAGGTLLQHLKELVLHTDLRREDRILYFTTCGWMMWNWLVSSLAVGATVVLYEGSPGYPSADSLFDVVAEEEVTVFGTGAKYLAALEKAGARPRETHRLDALKTILSTGSPLAPQSYDYVYRDVKEDVLLASISGGTDLISCFALGNPLLPVYRGELQCRGLGMAVSVLDEKGEPVRGATGELACRQAFPTVPLGFWNDPNDERFREAYFEKIPGVWCHGDYAILTERDSVIILGRSDATLNPGGVRIGTAEIYRQVETLDEVLESLAVGQRWQGDERIVLFVRLRRGLQLDENLRSLIEQTIRNNTTPRHTPAVIVQVAELPRTVSGKLVEVAVRKVIHGEPVENADALANPEALDLFRDLPELAG